MPNNASIELIKSIKKAKNIKELDHLLKSRTGINDDSSTQGLEKGISAELTDILARAESPETDIQSQIYETAKAEGKRNNTQYIREQLESTENKAKIKEIVRKSAEQLGELDYIIDAFTDKVRELQIKTPNAEYNNFVKSLFEAKDSIAKGFSPEKSLFKVNNFDNNEMRKARKEGYNALESSVTKELEVSREAKPSAKGKTQHSFVHDLLHKKTKPIASTLDPKTELENAIKYINEKILRTDLKEFTDPKFAQISNITGRIGTVKTANGKKTLPMIALDITIDNPSFTSQSNTLTAMAKKIASDLHLTHPPLTIAHQQENKNTLQIQLTPKMVKQLSEAYVKAHSADKTNVGSWEKRSSRDLSKGNNNAGITQ